MVGLAAAASSINRAYRGQKKYYWTVVHEWPLIAEDEQCRKMCFKGLNVGRNAIEVGRRASASLETPGRPHYRPIFARRLGAHRVTSP